jgi:hypothetical protein
LASPLSETAACNRLVSAGLVLRSEAEAEPKLRYQIDQRGDMILLGNTVGFDCRPGIPKPIVGTVDVANCGTNIEDSSADVWWRDDAGGGGGASASIDVKVPDARTTAVLTPSRRGQGDLRAAVLGRHL